MPTTEQNASTLQALPEKSGAGAKVHLAFLDGLRGLAALYVAIFHVYTKIQPLDSSTGDFRPFETLPLGGTFRYGEYAVVAFIVLSGFCLMLPTISRGFVSSAELQGFFKRRARRILPPYYAALFLSVAMLVASRYILKNTNSLNEVTWPTVTSHLLLLHNFKVEWRNAINAPMWSVATEWQIYFLFPFLLFPLWKKLGDIKFLGSVVVVASGLLLWPITEVWAGSVCIQMVAAFSIGMICVSIIRGYRSAYDPHTNPEEGKARAYSHLLPWRLLTFSLAVLLIGIAVFMPSLPQTSSWVGDISFAVMVGVLLITCTLSQDMNKNNRSSLPRAVFESRFAVWIGGFSYSLYLIHGPILAALYALIQKYTTDVSTQFVLMMTVAVPLTIALSYVFFLLFEKPFLRSRSTLPRVT